MLRLKRLDGDRSAHSNQSANSEILEGPHEHGHDGLSPNSLAKIITPRSVGSLPSRASSAQASFLGDRGACVSNIYALERVKRGTVPDRAPVAEGSNKPHGSRARSILYGSYEALK
jgi:hypothetical protein